MQLGVKEPNYNEVQIITQWYTSKTEEILNLVILVLWHYLDESSKYLHRKLQHLNNMWEIWTIRGRQTKMILPSPNSNFEEVIIASAGEVISRVTQSRQMKVCNNKSALTTTWRGFCLNSILLLQCSSKHGWLGNCSEQIPHCYKMYHKRTAKPTHAYEPYAIHTMHSWIHLSPKYLLIT